MALKMKHCIGRSGCDGKPATRGLCTRCYGKHSYAGTLHNFPTMRERTRQARATMPLTGREHNQRWRDRNYAARVWINGSLVHPTAAHGRHNAYTGYGCRGPMCADAQRWYRDTGESTIPEAREKHFTAQECAHYVSQLIK